MKKNLFLSTLFFLIITSVVMTACYKKKSSYNPATNNATVYMKGSVFSIASLQITTGSTVTWINDDSMAHTVTSNDGVSFNSGNIAPSSNFKFTFMTAGTYPYHCTLHPEMTGTVIVASSTGSTGGY